MFKNTVFLVPCYFSWPHFSEEVLTFIVKVRSNVITHTHTFVFRNWKVLEMIF